MVFWFHCDDEFATPLSVYLTIEAGGVDYDWMVWHTGYRTYQVFVDGYWYWPQRWWPVSGTPAEIISDVEVF